jgi:hypothetical protein
MIVYPPNLIFKYETINLEKQLTHEKCLYIYNRVNRYFSFANRTSKMLNTFNMEIIGHAFDIPIKVMEEKFNYVILHEISLQIVVAVKDYFDELEKANEFKLEVKERKVIEIKPYKRNLQI